MKKKLILILFSIYISIIIMAYMISAAVLGYKNFVKEDFVQVINNYRFDVKSKLKINSNVEESNEKLLTANDLIRAFGNAELHIIPQVDDGFLKKLILNGVKPSNYELLDDGVYFYIFESQQDAAKGLNEIANLPYSYFQTNTETYKIKNAIIFYVISSGNELDREQYKLRIKQIVEDLDKL